jgi:methylmalonyl-CoA mutase
MLNAIALTSYQGGHNEYFKYMYDLLRKGAGTSRFFGGGGGVICLMEIEELQATESRIYAP